MIGRFDVQHPRMAASGAFADWLIPLFGKKIADPGGRRTSFLTIRATGGERRARVNSRARGVPRGARRANEREKLGGGQGRKAREVTPGRPDGGDLTPAGFVAVPASAGMLSVAIPRLLGLLLTSVEFGQHHLPHRSVLCEQATQSFIGHPCWFDIAILGESTLQPLPCHVACAH